MSFFLTGFMGAGKSSVGRCLAELTGLSFADLDDCLVKQQGCTINEIFAARGEEFFRDLESALLRDLPRSPGGIYATGGGIVLRPENRKRMRELGRIIFLRTDWPNLECRLKLSKDRPLVNQQVNFQAVHDIWLTRQPLYLDADLIIDTDRLTVLQIAEHIVAFIQSEGD
jgi:shikimate kinase